MRTGRIKNATLATRFPINMIDESREYTMSDYSKFKTVRESAYSSVRPYHFHQIGKILKRVFGSPRLILDICAHIGCSTVNMSRLYPTARFISVEINKRVYNVLCDNIHTFKLKSRVTPVHGNGIPFIKRMGGSRVKADFVTLDPPWGGPSYTKRSNLMLALQNTNGTYVSIYDIINDIFVRNVSDTCVFKAPINFDIKTFKTNIHGSVKTYPVYNILTKAKKKRKISYFYVIVKYRPSQ